MATAQVIHDGFDFGEGPRWHDGQLWFSDFYRHAVYTLDPESGEETKVVDVPRQPSGLGWLPDGRLLVVSMTDQKVMRLEEDGSLVEHADISAHCGYHANDMLVDDQGRAYVGNFGYDLHTDMAQRSVEEILGDESAGRTDLVRVDPDGTVTVVAEGVRFPNGMVFVDGGRTLVLAETLRLQLTAFTVQDDGSLTDRRVWASTAEQMVAPDGIAADPQGGVWVSAALGPAVVRYAEGGEVTGQVETTQNAFACAVGGADGRTLYAMTAPSSEPKDVDGQSAGAIETAAI
ncbi:SMP-30/gluconolactonase/LRE family protein [Marihabitans asiaticum]|uniref:Sugar lactone lactonase YvrE n=1 Tax=Marihabitans asiaticum TaxID=415218 RepID=A0A560WGW4_9MICO|nr:SMP-30/gluconolactonase/LRE family protein [Marihabitans asiaticum]TWD16800.1 sugar lactone lactonase YvrE [Marihabitans asiaticum]